MNALFLICLGLFAWATPQADTLQVCFHEYAAHHSPEKLYLHTNKQTYQPGETIWFQGYLTDASYESQQPLSRFIYVELIRGSVIRRVKIKQGDDGFTGYLTLPPTLPSGTYVLRGYTRWQLNHSPEYMFTISIGVSPFGAPPSLITPATTPPEAAANLSEGIQLRFYPESGTYFAGCQSAIAFKATNSKGNSIRFTGELIDGKGNICTQVTTQHPGMGKFIFTPQTGETYSVIFWDSTGKRMAFLLPAITETGGNLQLLRHPGGYYVSASYTWKQPEEAQLYLHNKSEIQFLGKVVANLPGQASPTRINFRMDAEKLAPGVNQLLLVNSRGEILAKRAFYVYGAGGSYLTPYITQNRKNVEGKEIITLQIKLSAPSGTSLAGSFSASASIEPIRREPTQSNLHSYVHLSSEFAAPIEHPDYYFNSAYPQREREANLDLLMLTLDWDYYPLSSVFSGNTRQFCPKELTQSISGRIAPLTKKKQQDYTFTVMAPMIGYQSTHLLQTGDRFMMNPLNFQDTVSFFVKHSDGEENRLIWEQEQFPPLPTTTRFSPLTSAVSKYTFRPDTLHSISIKQDTLSAIIVRDKSPAPLLYRNTSPYLSPLGQTVFERRQIRERKDLEKYDNQSIMDYILGNFPIGRKQIIGFEERIISIKRISLWDELGGKPLEPFLYIDGIKQENTSVLKGISVRDVQTLVVLRGTEGALYNTIHGVILLELRNARHLMEEALSDKTRENPNTITLLGYQKPQSFSKAIQPGTYWNPLVKTNEQGEAVIEIELPANEKLPCTLRIEGSTSDGRYIYWKGNIPIYK